jgi:hypothetical protein
VAAKHTPQKTHQPRTTRKSPSQICVSPKKQNSKATAERGQSPKTTHNHRHIGKEGNNPLYAIAKTCKETNYFCRRNELIRNLHEQTQTN